MCVIIGPMRETDGRGIWAVLTQVDNWKRWKDMMSWGQRREAGAGKRLVFEEEMAHNLCSRGELSRPRTGVEQSRQR